MSRDLMDGRLLVMLFLFFLAFFWLVDAGHCDDRSRPGLPAGPIEWRATYRVTATGSNGRAHLCAVGPFTAYTAAHVIDKLGTGLEWHYGVQRGTLKVLYRFPKRDLAKVISDTPFPYYSPLAAEGPPITTPVYIGGWLWYRADLPIAYVTYSMGLDQDNELISEGASMRGSSGACEWAADGTVVAIHTAYAPYQAEGRPPINMAVGEPLWNGWREER